MTAGNSDVTMAPARRPELELLLACGRTRVMPEAVRRVIGARAKEIDWEYLIQKAFDHGIAPLIFRNINRICSDRVPQEQFNRFRSHVNFITLRNLALAGELVELLRLCGERGIRTLPIKGVVLAAAAYGDMSLRQVSDLDIFVDKADMLKAKEVLISQGYRPELELSGKEEAAYLEAHHDYKFIGPKNNIAVEIQWGISQWCFPFPSDFNELWLRHEVLYLAGRRVPIPQPDDLLLILCVHGSKHGWKQLKWICDIAELVGIYNEKINWERLLVLARRQGGERMLLFGLSLAHQILGLILPGQVLHLITNDRQIALLAGQVTNRLFADYSDTDPLQGGMAVFYFRIRERSRDKLAIVRRYLPEWFLSVFIPNSRDRDFLELPGFLSFCYYIVRPIRLLKEYCASLLDPFLKVFK